MNRPSEQTLIRFFRGQCLPEEQRAVKLYLAMDIDKEYVEACLIKAFPDLSKEHDATISQFEIDRVWNKLEARKPSITVRPLKRNRWYAYAAAVAFVVLSSTLLLVFKGKFNGNHQTTETAWNVITAASGGNKTVRLDDSSTVILFPGSALSIARAFNQSDRQVKLTGRAFFSVAHDRAKPFYVTAQGLTTKVLGTSFEINAAATENIITLHTGKISVSRTNKEIAQLKPDQQIRVSKKTGHFEVVAVRAAGTISWLNGELDYDQASLAAITADLENWYGVKITANSHVLNQKVTISFKELPIATVLDMLSKSAEFNYTINGKQITIRERGMEAN